MAVLAASVSLMFGSVAWGQDRGRYDNDHYYNRHDEAQHQGCRRGFDDGRHAGQFEAQRGRRFNFKNDGWEDSRGYEHWMGSKGQFKQAYREGYERGDRRAYATYSDRYRDRDDHRPRDHDDWRCKTNFERPISTVESAAPGPLSCRDGRPRLSSRAKLDPEIVSPLCTRSGVRSPAYHN